jgi:long-chain acyl-CoA synthetase
MSHGSGIYIVPHLAKAALNVVPESGAFEADEIFALARAHRGVTLFAAPTMVKRLVDAPDDGPLPGLKTIVYGGGPMYVADIKAAMARFGQVFAQIYGQGESPMTITASDKSVHAQSSHPDYEARLGSVGLPFAGVEVMVADERDRALPPGAVGEICVRGPVVMRGYWHNPEASAAALAGGWLHTGDVGAFDDAGFLTLKDRSKDLIISGGSNIYPREVEEALLTHPGVAEVSVVGRQHPEWGEEVVAFVVARAGAAPTPAVLDAHCLDNIARFKRPKEYRFVDTLPKNETGKVLKTALRALL